MWTVVNGFDQTNAIDFASIKFTQKANDPSSDLQFELLDIGSTLALSSNMEVIIFDETTSISPAHNVLPDNTVNWASGGWSDSGTLTGLFALGSTSTTLTFANNAVGTALLSGNAINGYIHVGQTYMLSVYQTINSTLTNCSALVKLQFLDASFNVLSTVSNTRTTPVGTQQRISLSGVAPANTVYATAFFGGQTTNTTNSGSITYVQPQLEPVWFPSNVTYPTTVLNETNLNALSMPDSTFTSATRLFAGYINDLQRTYDGINRTWAITCAPPQSMLDAGAVNGVISNINIAFTNQYDSQMISTVNSTYFAGYLTVAAPNNFIGSPLVQGVLVANASYADVSFRDILNSCCDQSGYTYFVGPDYRIYYNPQYYYSASFGFSDTPDNAMTFAYYDYQYEEDATQQKRIIKVIGGNYIAGAISDIYSGDGATKIFTLTTQPYNVQACTVGGTSQKVGVSGSATLGSGGIVAVYDKSNRKLTFQTAPVSGTNNVVFTYTYEAPVSAVLLDQDTTNNVVAPNYTVPSFTTKVNDNTISDLPTAINRGLAELSKYGAPRILITFKAAKYVQPGYVVSFTSALDGIANIPFIVQEVDASYLGGGINEFAYTLGSYNPTIVDHLRNNNKALNRSTTTAGVTASARNDLVFYESAYYSESIKFTKIIAAPNKYGTGKYGTATYS